MSDRLVAQRPRWGQWSRSFSTQAAMTRYTDELAGSLLLAQVYLEVKTGASLRTRRQLVCSTRSLSRIYAPEERQVQMFLRPTSPALATSQIRWRKSRFARMAKGIGEAYSAWEVSLRRGISIKVSD